MGQTDDQSESAFADAVARMIRSAENIGPMIETGASEMRRQAESAGKLLGASIAWLARGGARVFSPADPGPWPYDGLARQEWPHVPLQLARAYADEYVRTGQRP